MPEPTPPPAPPADWRTSLPDDLKAHESLKDFKDAGSLAKAYVDTKALVGASLRVPGPDASPELRREFINRLHEKLPNVTYLPSNAEELAAVEPHLWKALGKPEQAKEYSLEGVDVSDVQLDAEKLQNAAHALGLTKAQFKALAKSAADDLREQAKGEKLWADTMKREWGLAYNDKLQAAVDVATKLGAPAATIEQLKSGRMHPDHVKFYAKLSESLGGTGRAVGDQGPGKSGALAPAEALARIEELRSEPAYLRAHENPARHEQIMRKIDELFPQAYPDLVGKK